MQTNNIPIKHQMLKNSTFSQKFKQKKMQTDNIPEFSISSKNS